MHYVSTASYGLNVHTWVACVVVSAIVVLGSSPTNAQNSAAHGDFEVRAGMVAPPTVEVVAEGAHDMQSSEPLRQRSCVGYVSRQPDVNLIYNDEGTGSAPIISATSETDIVLLVGSARNIWYCDDDTVGTNPVVTLPPGSGTYAIWVGTRQADGRADATLSITEERGDGRRSVSGECGEPTARRPSNVSLDQWGEFQCMSPSEADSRWPACLPREAYSDDRGDGCPGAERCCPPPGVDPEPVNDDGQEFASGSCGDSSARRPEGVGYSDWAGYECSDRDDTSALWSDCLSREAYSDVRGDGCPGAQRCCPPDGFDPRAAALAARQSGVQQQEQPSPAMEPDVPREQPNANAPPPLTQTEEAPDTSRLSGATIEDGAVLIPGTPWNNERAEFRVVWRGFDATLAAHERSDSGSELVTSIAVRNGREIRFDRSLYAVRDGRTLRATRSATLDAASRRGQDLVIRSGESIQLLGAAGNGRCYIRSGDDAAVYECPEGDAWEDADGGWHGPFPDTFQLWVLVRGDSGQAGWVWIDTADPAFDIVLR